MPTMLPSSPTDVAEPCAIGLLLMDLDDAVTGTASRPRQRTPHRCDGCDAHGPGIDVWATDSETGEELWLCPKCDER